MFGDDGEERRYADFNKKEMVIMLPPFADPIQYPGGYEFAEGQMAICKQNLQVITEDFKDQPVEQSE